jgi:uncharacterized protein YjgD (DUF1641 family)
MNDQNIQEQINQLNQKMDLVLDSLDRQNRKAESVEDLLADLQIVGKDMYDTAVVELEDQQVEVDLEQVKNMGIKLLLNINNIADILSLFESSVDFVKDAAPLARESIIDLTHKLNVIEQKGYFEFFAEVSRIIDNVVTHFTAEDVRLLADNIVTIVGTLKKLTQPELMCSVQNALKVYQSIDSKNAPEYSIFKLIRELNKPEMKKAMGFMVLFMKNMTKE